MIMLKTWLFHSNQNTPKAMKKLYLLIFLYLFEQPSH